MTVSGPGLPDGFTDFAFAHRGLHGVAGPENSPSAFRAAINRGYGIELDVQSSADSRAMVFHDDNLERLTAETGPIRARKTSELGAIRLKRGADMIPTLDAVLRLVAGRVPLLIEVKDQDGAMGAQNIGPLEYSVARALHSYDGAVAQCNHRRRPEVVSRPEMLVAECQGRRESIICTAATRRRKVGQRATGLGRQPGHRVHIQGFPEFRPGGGVVRKLPNV